MRRVIGKLGGVKEKTQRRKKKMDKGDDESGE